MAPETPFRILSNYPDSVCLMRLSLVCAAVSLGTEHAEAVLYLFIVNFCLDYVDGYLARKLNQATSFGAFLDVMIDNLSRGLLWTWGSSCAWPCLFPLLEMTAFVCTHKAAGVNWKAAYASETPWWVKMTLSNGFRNPAGVFSIMGLMGCPIWVWAIRWLPQTVYSSPWWGLILIPGRCWTAAVELWIVMAHMQSLLAGDVEAWRKRQSS